MLRISKARSPQQLVTYHQREFTAVHESYYSEGNRVVGVWHGQLREVFGLPEAIDLEAFSRLTRAHHPTTDETLIRGVTRGGWDLTFSAPKGVSLAGIVGDDERVRVAHRESVAAALRLIEPYTQARGVRIALEEGRPVRRDVTTGRALWATYAHYLARPVDGVEQPQLHTHVIGFNVTQTDDGRWHSVQPREWFRTQQLGTMAYYAELAVRLQALGYTIERGPYDEPRVVGFTEAYLEASSPRRQQIEEALAAQGRSGPAAAEEAALRTRARKVHRPPEQVRADHLALAREHGNQPQRVVAQALARGFVKQSGQFDELINTSTHEAVQRAKDRGMERSAVIEDRTLLADALRIGLGHVTVASVAAEFERRLGVGEFVPRTSHSAARAFTTPEMLTLERTNIELMRAGQSTCPAIADIDVAATYPHLNPDQQVAVQTILGSRDQIQALEGIAGSGKSTALAVLHQAAAAAGWRVEGLAPSTPAANNLERAGIKSQTLQRHLATPLVPRDHLSFADRVRRGIDPEHAERLLILDEASLASSVQVHQLLTTLGPRDRVLLVGDIGQHQSVDAGKAHEQLQDHGIGAARLSKIVRQRGPGYRQIVSRLAARQTGPAIAALQRRGRVHVVPDRHARLTALAADYVASPEGTLIIAPDNQTRRDINAVVHQALQAKGGVERDGRLTPVLLPRTDLTTSDLAYADSFTAGDVLRFNKGSAVLGVEAGTYATVVGRERATNRVTVALETGEERTYDARAVQPSVYQVAERSFAPGDRVQFTAPSRALRVANRDLGTVHAVRRGAIVIDLDDNRRVTYRFTGQAHLDFGYAVTSHSAQALTVERVLLHVDTDHAGEVLVNQRLAYVALSRGRSDAQIYTDDYAMLQRHLGRDVSKREAHELGHGTGTWG